MVAGLGGLRLAAQEPEVRGVLLTDASKDESAVWLQGTPQFRVDALVVIESRDGSYRGTYEVKHVLDGHLLLKSALREPYLAGSRVLQ